MFKCLCRGGVFNQSPLKNSKQENYLKKSYRNVLNLDFSTTGLNQKWGADIMDTHTF